MRGLSVPIKNSFLNRYLLTKVITHPVTNSFDTKKIFLTNLKNVLPENKVHVIYRGINFDEWFSRSVSPVKYRENDEIIIGNVGRLVKQKGQHYLIDLALKLKEKGLKFKIIIAGIGKLEAELKELIAKNNLEQEIILAGFFSNVRDFLNSIDIFVFPSIWEGFGYALVEAMAEELPAVAFVKTSNPEIIPNKEIGFLVDYPDIDEFADTVFKLAQNPNLRKQVGEKAKESVIRRFNFDVIIREWEKLLG